MLFQVIWFVLWGVLWAVYFMLDGFDLGAGMLYPFVAGSEAEKGAVLDSIGPVWGGNEVWLITAGGATFAAFPTTYALMFSYLYTALLLLLFSLILRGVAIEFRGKAEGAGWRKGWGLMLWLGSFLPALLFGVAFGNIFMGLPMDAQGYHGGFMSLLNPYGLLTGVLFVMLFLVHGSLWIALKTGGRTEGRARRAANGLWYALLAAAVAFLASTVFATKLYVNYLKAPALLVLPAAAVLALLAIKFFAVKGRNLQAFFASCAAIVMVAFTGVAGLFPNLIPSSIDPASSLTLFNSSSSPYTLKIMTAVAAVFVPIVILYQIWTYRVFRHKAVDAAGGKGTY
ncbi:MAG: cytochrome d ubiquinol oxidase subunit II [Nitrospiraceae bacterium]|nr:cytochrome d ubiquinol oxidase subunit II [Nitrospiraceae bacterium]